MRERRREVKEWQETKVESFGYEHHKALHYSYILFSVHFRTDSNSVRKKNLKKFCKIFRTELDLVRKQKTIFKPRKNSEPNPIRFGRKVAIF